jgi:hypothetical protein
MTVIGCDNGSTNSNGKGNLSKMNIVGATNLFIAPVSTARSVRATRDTSVNKLFKITEDGYVQEVTYTYEDEEGNQTSNSETFIPTHIFNVNVNYIIICFSSEVYLVRKTDGAVFIISNTYNDIPSKNVIYVTNRQAVFNDINGNIYYLANNKIIKINIQNPLSITKQNYSPDTDSVSGFVIDNFGNAVYFGRDASNNEVSRIRRGVGGLRNLSSQNARFAWTGIDNTNIYFFDSNESNTGTQIKKYLSDVNEIENFGTDMTNFSGFGGNGYILKMDNRIVTCSVLQNTVYEIYPNFDTIQGYGSGNQTLGLKSIKIAANSNNFYYITGDNTSNEPVLLKIDAATDVPQTILTGYDIYRFTVSSEDEITFNALNMNNMRKVIGTISSTGNVGIIDETLNTEVTVLERIN